MSSDSWLEKIQENYLNPCVACHEGLGACTCPSAAAFRMILGQVTHELKKSWEAEAYAWNRGYDVRRAMERGRKS